MITLPACEFTLDVPDLRVRIPRSLCDSVYVFLRDLKTGYVQVTLKNPSRPRTTGEGSQNHHINGHIAQICRDTGNSFDDMKLMLKLIAMDQGRYPFRTIQDIRLPYSETELDTRQAAEWIEVIHQFAAEQGIHLEDIDG